MKVRTEKGLSDFVPFKNLFNEFWAKDTSRKVKAAIHAKHAAGEYTNIHPPIGYIIDSENRNHLIVDEETRWIVEKIFDLAAHGAGRKRIIVKLIEEKVPTPGYILYQRYGMRPNIYKNAPPEKAYDWTMSAVRDILKNEIYIGNSVHNRFGTISYKNSKRIRCDSDKWFRVEGTHEPIIDKDVFWQVQGQIKSRHRKQGDGTTHIFAGLLKCADCGKSMAIGRANKDARHRYFNCNTYRKYSSLPSTCTAHSIRYDVLYHYVLTRIQHWVYQAQTDEQQLINSLMNTTNREQQALFKKQNAELKKAEKRKAEVDRLFTKVYEDWAEDRITEYNFRMLSQKYQAEQQAIEEKLGQLQAAMEKEKETATGVGKWVTLVKQCAYPTELTAELLNTLIEKILIHEPVKDSTGFKDQEIEIYYRFIGKID